MQHIASANELKFPHVICFAHLLHNCLKHSFEAQEIKKIFEKREIKDMQETPN